MVKQLLAKLVLLVAVVLGGMSSALAETVTFDATTDVTENAPEYQTSEASYTAADGSVWKATGYGATANTNIVIGKGGGNYLETPLVNGTITSVDVTWSGPTDFYLALQTTDGTVLETKSNIFINTTETFTVTGEYSQLRLVGSRSGSGDAPATIIKVVVTYTPYTYTPPYFTASDVDITHDAIGGVIEYTLNNEVTGGSVSAAVNSGDWLTLGSGTTSTISFTCSANTTTSARTATVTLTYTYNTNQTVTKAVTITQAGYVAHPAPADWVETNLADLTEDDFFVIVGTMQNNTNTYALPNNMGTTKAPTAISVSVSNGKLDSAPNDNLIWTLKGNATDGYTFYPKESSDKYLYCKATATSGGNDNIRVGSGTRKVFILNNNKQLVTNDGYVKRYLYIYKETEIVKDWRGCVKDDRTHITTSITFYKMKQKATLNSYGYATFSSSNPIKFSDSDDFTAWAITSISGTTITFEQVTGEVSQGTGVLLKGNANQTVYLAIATGSGTDLTTNLLEAITSATHIDDNQFYGLSGNTLVKVNAGWVPAGKALLPASEVPNASRLTFVFEDVQGISTIEHSPLMIDDAVYNLNGQRVDSPKKGLYIVNGKKVIMK